MGSSNHISLACGGGGRAMRALLEEVVFPRLAPSLLQTEEDAAVLELGGLRWAFTTDGYVVDPLFFPGGDIGRLAVNGTVNDLAMRGAAPRYVSLGLILEEGFPLADLERVLDSVGLAAHEAGVEVVTGDTKVVPRGHVDKLFVHTAGLGAVPSGVDVSAANARPGDRILLSGGLGEHGIAVLSQRQSLAFEAEVVSDTVPLNALVAAMLHERPAAIHTLRDLTRGGLAAGANEIARSSGVGLNLEEAKIPVRPPVTAACELLGLDPLHLANEGKFLACVEPGEVGKILAVLRAHPYGREAQAIGWVGTEHAGKVYLKTVVGGTRIVDVPEGELLPRIC